MDSTEERSPADVAFAARAGETLSDALLDRRGWLEAFRAEPVRLPAEQFIGELLLELRRDRAQRGQPTLPRGLDREAVAPLTKPVEDVLRVLALSRDAGLHGVIAMSTGAGALAPWVVVDVYSTQVRRSLGGLVPGEWLERRPPDRALTEWMRDLAEGPGGSLPQPNLRVQVVDEREATRGFVTQIADSFRTAVRYFTSSGGGGQRFTVHTRQHQFQLESYPQYWYSPVVFGATLTSPVDGMLATGHYHFQGWQNGTVVTDGGVYFAGPGSTAATLRNI